MTLGLSKIYTPSAGQVGNATSYNTDISALFNAFSGLEAQTASLGGLTITPTANSTTTLNITNAAGTSIFSVDTTNGLAKFKSASVVAQNITSVDLNTNFATSSTTFTARTGASLTLTTVKATAKVLLLCRSNWSTSHTGDVNISLRTNLDSGTYVSNGTHTIPVGIYQAITFSHLFTGLTAASHTFAIEVLTDVSTITNSCSTLPQVYTFELIAMEI